MIIENVISAFEVVFSIQTLALMAIGVTGGLIAGAIPGFTIAMAVVLTLPSPSLCRLNRGWQQWLVYL